MHRAEHEGDERLADSFESLLDDELTDGEVARLLHSLRDDDRSRRVFKEVLGVRVLLDLALGTPSSPTTQARCSKARGLLPGYLGERLTPSETAEFSRHLDECVDCAGNFRHLTEKRALRTVGEPSPARRDSRVSRLTLLGVTTAIVGVALVTVAHFVPESSSDTPRVEALTRVFQGPGSHGFRDADVLPLLPGTQKDVDALRQVFWKASHNGATVLIAYLKTHQPRWLESIGTHPVLSSLVRELGATGLESADQQRLRVFLCWLHDRRLPLSYAARASEIIAKTAGDGSRGFLWTVIEGLTNLPDQEARSAVHVAMAGLDMLTRDPADTPRFLKLHRRFIELRWADSLDQTVRALERHNYAGLTDLCYDLLEDRHALYRFGSPDYPGGFLTAVARRFDTDGGLRERVRTVARSGAFAYGRLLAATILDRTEPGKGWKDAVRNLAQDSDPQLRLAAVNHLGFFGVFSEDRGLLAAVRDDDPIETVRAAAQRAFDRLSSGSSTPPTR